MILRISVVLFCGVVFLSGNYLLSQDTAPGTGGDTGTVPVVGELELFPGQDPGQAEKIEVTITPPQEKKTLQE